MTTTKKFIIKIADEKEIDENDFSFGAFRHRIHIRIDCIITSVIFKEIFIIRLQNVSRVIQITTFTVNKSKICLQMNQKK